MAKNLQRRVEVEELNLVPTNHDEQTVTQSSVIQGDSERLKTVQECSFVCLKGKKIGSKIYVFRQVAMREKFNFFPAFFVKCSMSNGYDPAQLPQMLQETKQQI